MFTRILRNFTCFFLEKISLFVENNMFCFYKKCIFAPFMKIRELVNLILIKNRNCIGKIINLNYTYEFIYNYKTIKKSSCKKICASVFNIYRIWLYS